MKEIYLFPVRKCLENWVFLRFCMKIKFNFSVMLRNCDVNLQRDGLNIINFRCFRLEVYTRGGRKPIQNW